MVTLNGKSQAPFLHFYQTLLFQTRKKWWKNPPEAGRLVNWKADFLTRRQPIPTW